MITYNTGVVTLTHIYRATGGGVTFSANLAGETAFDYFTDTPAANDAIYFGKNTSYRHFSDLVFNVGTALAGTDVVLRWEFYNGSAWVEMTNTQDDTNGFTTLAVNRFRFGFPYYWRTVAVNGITGLWVRCRLHSFTTVTEGGANITTAVSGRDGDVDIDDYTEGSPCSLTLVYDYLIANAPWLNIVKTLNHFDFKQVNLDINSRLVTKSESFELGFRGTSQASGNNDLGFLRMGDKIDDYFGRNGSTLIFYGEANSYPVGFSGNTQIYGSNFIGIGGVGYPGWLGEWIDNNIDGINWMPQTTPIVRNNRLVNPGIWICVGGFPTVFDRNRVILTGSQMGYFYNADGNFDNLDYVFLNASGASFLYFYAVLSNPTFNFTNPNPLLPGVTTPNKIIRRNITEPTTAYPKVWYFDESEGTYTDYTTEFGDEATDDVPIGGDVGDIYYFGTTGVFNNPVWAITTNLGSNDFVYIYEYYAGGAWREFSPRWDRSSNFTVSDRMYFGKDNYARTGSSLNINGYTGYYMRMRIATKGTGSPMISRILWASQTGASGWNIYEKFNLDLKVADKANAIIAGATIRIDLDGANIYTGTTDASGNMTQQVLINRRWYFDPINFYENYQQIAEVVYNDYDLIISKAGYETQRLKITMNKKQVLLYKLRHSISPSRDEMGEEFR